MIAHNDLFNCETELSVEDKISKLKVLEEKAKLMVTCEYEHRKLLFDFIEKEEDIEKGIDLLEILISGVVKNKLHELTNEKKDHSSASTVSGVMRQF
ncbi:hypothetical protein NPIL_156381 [Nephila pilipes]|uniref:Uncharacterized protein n=1 Tax=Nephila pilipes TaxID=299642 RepID=A0A8X6PV49_NEPPI|nr:hypothetical protein NPIL_156381 [Nephila pilipes]